MSAIVNRTVGCLAILAAVPGGQTWAQQVAVPATAERVDIPYTELHTLHSRIIGEDYLIYVRLPSTYATSTAAFPVLYSTDANRNFSIIAGALQMLTTPSPPELPEVVVIGIGYPERTPGDLLEWAIGRTRDLTPTNVPTLDRYWTARVSGVAGREVPVRTGGAATFLRFLQEELIPWAEANYRISHTDRSLAGYSYGGLFALYALLQAPETFQRYFAGSPSIEYDDSVIFRLEERSARGRSDLPAQLFTTIGGLEGDTALANVTRMADRLRARRYASLRLETQVFEGETHRSCVPAAFSRALRVLYGPAARTARRGPASPG